MINYDLLKEVTRLGHLASLTTLVYSKIFKLETFRYKNIYLEISLYINVRTVICSL